MGRCPAGDLRGSGYHPWALNGASTSIPKRVATEDRRTLVRGADRGRRQGSGAAGARGARDHRAGADALARPRRYRALYLKRYPYAIFYTVTDEEVRVMAIAHERREPLYWKGR